MDLSSKKFNSYLFISLICLGLYFVISLPISVYEYFSRYNNYHLDNCFFENYNIVYDYGLYKLDSNITVKNCTQKLNICCSDYNYWNQIVSNNNTKCYYNNDCDIVPEFIKYSSFNLFQISSFIFGALLALNIIYYCESKRQVIRVEYEEIIN